MVSKWTQMIPNGPLPIPIPGVSKSLLPGGKQIRNKQMFKMILHRVRVRVRSTLAHPHWVPRIAVTWGDVQVHALGLSVAEPKTPPQTLPHWLFGCDYGSFFLYGLAKFAQHAAALDANKY